MDRTRRTLLRSGLQAGAGSLLFAGTLPGETSATPQAAASQNVSKTGPVPGGPADGRPLLELAPYPTRVFVEDASGMLRQAERSANEFHSRHVSVALDVHESSTAVSVHSPGGPLSRVMLRWEQTFPVDTLLMGDAWERSYGDLQWRFLQPERVMPWYFAAHHQGSGRTFLLGVQTGPSALCFWTVDAEGISLWLDLRNGGSPSLPGDRRIPAATILSTSNQPGESPFAALRRFCRALCPKPRPLRGPVCGNNNWYYAYGRNFDASAMRRDAHFLAEISAGSKVRPYCVIDAGWTPGGDCPGGPWTAGDPRRFPDMAGLAKDMAAMGVRPGIWMRPTALTIVDDPRRLRSGPAPAAEKPLDVTLPENVAMIHADMARIRGWGYELIKHDFSTQDLFGRWGFQMNAEITDTGWHFHNQALTNAEIVLEHYRNLRSGAGDAVLLGCNTIGHLAAGIFEVQRIGDDTSGRDWERTRRMGVNTLAFRLAQHGAFFACDADCAAHTARTPWELDRQFLDLVAQSGTALFVSANPETTTPEQKEAFRGAMLRALSQPRDVPAEPLDWLYTTSPEQWRFRDAAAVRYHWAGAQGVQPFKA